MKELLLAALCAIVLTGCANEYLIVTNDGSVISTVEEPEYDEDSGMLKFEDDDGREQQIPKESVKSIIER
ncbi:protein of unknown function [Pseudomonas oryzae]|uniref:Lipoprotein YgdI/YgdR-like SH3-like domain-containing protein n=2 Tax=Pseudomonas oryzae TaxID=1392877 RepID=A0A1H1R4P9_9PSED|nr:protein of unknown function [Pseudomonas oryzae]